MNSKDIKVITGIIKSFSITDIGIMTRFANTLADHYESIIKCSCGNKAEFICECGNILCGEDQCNCDGSVSPFKEGFKKLCGGD